MTRLAYIALFLIGLIAIVYALMSAGGGKPSENRLEAYARGEIEKLDFSQAGTSASNAPFYLEDGSAVSLDAFMGKVVLVNFWATWCAPCEKEMPSLGALQPARGGDRFEVVAISVDAQERTRWRFLARKSGASQDSFYFYQEDGPAIAPTAWAYYSYNAFYRKYGWIWQSKDV